MLITKEIEIILTNRNIKSSTVKYKLISKNIGDIVKIPISYIAKKSHVIIIASCDYCNAELSMPYSSYNKRIKTIDKISCSNKSCSNQKIKDVCLKKYGVENPFQSDEIKLKSKTTNLEKYGCEYASQSYEFKLNLIKSNLEKYGVENVFQNDNIKMKSKKTNLEKYGVENVFQSDDIKKIIKNSLIIKYGVDHPLKSNSILNNVKKTNLEKYGVENVEHSDYLRRIYKITNNINYIKYLYDGISLFNCDKGHKFEINISNYYNRLKSNIPLCTVCNPIGDYKSIKEKNLHEYIKSIYSNEIIQSYRDGLEIDIFLPELKLGFEFNGLYWHSEKFKEKNYHLDKTNHFKEKGIRIIHIWEDDWTLREDIVKSQINNLLGNSKKIFARKCVIKEITNTKESKKFLDENHIQGANSSKIKIGLYHTVTQSNGATNEELVSIMTFDQSEGRLKMDNSGYNLSRFCNKINTNVIGGASKLLSYFIKVYKPSRIVSYADKDWSIGSLYYTLGFENIGGNGPDYKYIVDGKRVHKSRYKKSRLGIQGTSITEHQETKRLGIHRIYDCGKIKFEKLLNI